MGYYTEYEVRVCNATEEQREFIEHFLVDGVGLDYAGDDHGYYYGDAKWYDWEEDLCALTDVLRGVTIEVDGVGEERYDFWTATVKDGRCDYREATVTYPEHDPNNMERPNIFGMKYQAAMRRVSELLEK